MMRTPSIVGSSLVAALLGLQVPASAQVPAETAAPTPAPVVPASPSPVAQPSPAVPPPVAATPAPVVPTPSQVKPAPVSARKALGSADDDEAAKQLAAELEPTPGGLTADEVVRKTLENSPQLNKGRYEADKAAANKARAKLAYAPRLDLMGSYTRLSTINPPNLFEGIFSQMQPGMGDMDPSTGSGGAGGSSSKACNPDNPLIPCYNQWMARATLTLPITDWFLTIAPTYKGAAKLADVAEHQRQAQELQIAHEARIAFYDYVHASGSEAVAKASVRVLQASVEDLESLVRVGASTTTELARASAARANAEAMAIHLHGMVQVTLERLSQLTGEKIDAVRGIGEPLVGIDVGAPPTVDELLTQAKADRPELKALRSLENAREHFARARRGAVMPKIAGTGNFYYANPNPRFIPPTKEFKETWDVGLMLSWSPNDAAYAYTQAQDAETELRIVAEDLRAFEQGIAIESASAATGITTATAEIAAKTEGLDAARRYHADQRALMLAGAATPNDVLLAERDLTQAALEWVNAFVNARVAQANLLKAQGKTGLSATKGPTQQDAVAAGSTP